MTTADLIAEYRAHEHEIGVYADDGSILRDGIVIFGLDAPALAGWILTIHDPDYALDLLLRMDPSHTGHLGTLTKEKHEAVRILLASVTAPTV